MEQEFKLTKHAIEQYLNRLKLAGATIPNDPEKPLRKLLSRAVEARIKPGFKVNRLFNHGFKAVRYLEAEGWRFVVAEDGTVLTVEHVNPTKN